jgi:hypothetical protein
MGQSRYDDCGLEDLARRGGKTVLWIQEITIKSHPESVVAPVAATKLFTVVAAGGFLTAHRPADE